MKVPNQSMLVKLLGGLLLSGYLTAPVFAVTNTWDANGATAGVTDGAGTWSTSVANWWNGTTDVVWPNGTSDGAIIGNNNGAAGTITLTGPLNVNYIAFVAPGSGTYTISGSTLTLSGLTPTISNSVNATISSALAGTAGLLKTGAGMLSLSGSGITYSGNTTVNSGTLSVTGMTADFSVQSGTLLVSGTATFVGPADPVWVNIGNSSGPGTLTITNNGTVQLARFLIARTGNAGTVNMSGGTFTQSGSSDNTYIGFAGPATWIQTAGVATINTTHQLILVNSGDSGAANVTISGGSFGQVNAGGYFEVGGSGTGLATLTITNNGIVTSAGTFTIGFGSGSQGIVNMNGGSFTNSFTTGPASIGNSGTGNWIQTAGFANFTNQIIVANSANAGSITVSGGTFIAPNATTFLGNSTGLATLTVTNTGLISLQTLQFGAVSGSKAMVNLNGGTLQIGTGGITFGNGTGTISFNGGALQAVGNMSIANNANLHGIVNNGGAVFDSSNFTMTVNSALAAGVGSGGLTKLGTGTVVLAAVNSYIGSTLVSNGILRAGIANTITNSALLDVEQVSGGSTGRFDLAGFNQLIRGLSGNGFVTNSTGTMATLMVSNTSATTFSGVLSGSNSLAMVGNSVLTFSGIDTYLGNTSISNGTLLVNGTLANTPTVNVYTNATLGGFGTINGAVIVAGGGTLNPTAGGTLRLLGGLVNSGIITGNTGGLLVSGNFTNIGIAKLFNGSSTFNGVVVNSGTFSTDPATMNFTTFSNGPSGVITMVSGDVYNFTSNFFNQSTAKLSYNTAQGKFDFDGGSGTQVMQVAGLSLGGYGSTMMGGATNPVFVSGMSGLESTNSFSFAGGPPQDSIWGYTNNFALGTLEVGPNSLLTLVDSFPSDGLTSGLYVASLQLDTGAHLFISNSVQLYFMNTNSDYSVQLGGASWDGSSQVWIENGAGYHQIALVPEPSVLLMWLGGGLTLWAMRRRRAS